MNVFLLVGLAKASVFPIPNSPKVWQYYLSKADTTSPTARMLAKHILRKAYAVGNLPNKIEIPDEGGERLLISYGWHGGKRVKDIQDVWNNVLRDFLKGDVSPWKATDLQWILKNKVLTCESAAVLGKYLFSSQFKTKIVYFLSGYILPSGEKIILPGGHAMLLIEAEDGYVLLDQYGSYPWGEEVLRYVKEVLRFSPGNVLYKEARRILVIATEMPQGWNKDLDENMDDENTAKKVEKNLRPFSGVKELLKSGLYYLKW